MTQIGHFITLCFFLNNKKELPQSGQLLSTSLIVQFILGITILAMIIDPVEASLQIGIKVLFSLFFVFVVVLFARKFKLFLPAITAIIMCENLIAAIGLPVVVWMQYADDMVYIPFYLSIFLVVWGVAVAGFILRQIFSIKSGMTLFVSTLYFIIADLGSFLFVAA